jgi:hypothetical protein
MPSREKIHWKREKSVCEERFAALDLMADAAVTGKACAEIPWQAPYSLGW